MQFAACEQSARTCALAHPPHESAEQLVESGTRFCTERLPCSERAHRWGWGAWALKSRSHLIVPADCWDEAKKRHPPRVALPTGDRTMRVPDSVVENASEWVHRPSSELCDVVNGETTHRVSAAGVLLLPSGLMNLRGAQGAHQWL